MKKAAVILLTICFCLSVFGCATVPRGLSRAEQKRVEKENKEMFVKGLSAFCGLTIGAFTGAAMSNEAQRVSSMATGGLIGGVAGFGIGYIIVEMMKNMEEKPGAGKAKEYFQEYKNIQGKD